jgi:hypothetical protein
MSLRQILVAEAAKLPPHLAELADVLPPDLRGLVYELPPRLIKVAAEAPAYVDRRAGAALLTQHVTRVSHRTLEAWRLPWWHVDHKAVTLLIVLFAVAYSKLAAAPMVMGGRRSAVEQHVATTPALLADRGEPRRQAKLIRTRESAVRAHLQRKDDQTPA